MERIRVELRVGRKGASQCGSGRVLRGRPKAADPGRTQSPVRAATIPTATVAVAVAVAVGTVTTVGTATTSTVVDTPCEAIPADRRDGPAPGDAGT